MSSASESEEEDVYELPAPTPNTFKGRESVSAEAFGTWNKKTDFVPPIIEKTEDQKLK